jgi:hypothetical protein
LNVHLHTESTRCKTLPTPTLFTPTLFTPTLPTLDSPRCRRRLKRWAVHACVLRGAQDGAGQESSKGNAVQGSAATLSKVPPFFYPQCHLSSIPSATFLLSPAPPFFYPQCHLSSIPSATFLLSAVPPFFYPQCHLSSIRSATFLLSPAPPFFYPQRHISSIRLASRHTLTRNRLKESTDVDYEKGTVICKQDDRGFEMYFIVSGENG